MASVVSRSYSGRSRQRSRSIAVLGVEAVAACSSSSLSTRDPGLVDAAEQLRILDGTPRPPDGAAPG